MRQQINLYQRARRIQVQISSRSMLLVTAIVTSALLSLWAYGQFSVTRLQQQVTLLQQQQAAQANLTNAASALYGETINATELQQQVTHLTHQLQDRRQALQLLRVRTPLTHPGFATRLAALAHPHIEGVWLESIVLNNQPGIQSLRGRSLNPALVAGYLRALGNEPALAGTRFNEVRILGPKYVNEDDKAETGTTQPTTGVRFQVNNNAGNANISDIALANHSAAGSAT